MKRLIQMWTGAALVAGSLAVMVSPVGAGTEFLQCRPTVSANIDQGSPICDLNTGSGLNDLVSAAPGGPLVVLEPNTNIHQAEWESAPSAGPLVLFPGPVTLDLVMANMVENAGSNDICWSKHAVLPDGTERIIVPFHCFENPLPALGFICPFAGVSGGIVGPPGTVDIPAACIAAADLVTETVVSNILVPTVLPPGTVIELSVACPGASFIALFFNDGLDVDADGVLEFSTLTEVQPIPIDIDIKPASDPNCFNSDGNGVIPVAILGSATLDVNDIVVGSLALDGQVVAVKGQSKIMCHLEDSNGDGFTDLVCKFEDEDGTYVQGDGTGTVTGFLSDGTGIAGSDSICITQ